MALRWLDRPSLIVGGSVLACAASALRASSAGGGALAQALGEEQAGRVLAGLKGLPGWSGLTAEQLEVDVVQGGLTNQLYKLSRSGSGTPVDPVLLRIYGLGTDEFFCREEEIAAFEALSAVGAGPRCFGVFPGGRLEQFLNGRTLAREDVKDPSISDQIAIAMAKFHTCAPPQRPARPAPLTRPAHRDGCAPQEQPGHRRLSRAGARRHRRQVAGGGQAEAVGAGPLRIRGGPRDHRRLHRRHQPGSARQRIRRAEASPGASPAPPSPYLREVRRL